ncbi:GNAT family N-acetyltransferase [Catellatospora tritici]|uniref:GNAT family N-acetyltransferase n=1 Tax=Catellatospora tritici TaxID=2851566 RepID=UPI001C2D13AF|nr:GNAT family N-acetyltransferase [Catellatospora tritici]MBV1853064.1 GNAT family N-acetyltransferase [Catellatospora tritici]
MIRTAVPDDVPVLLDLIAELADYEGAPHEAKATPAQLHEALFGPYPAAFAHVAVDDQTGETVGMALWFLNYSTWDGVHGVYLEDLYVRPAARGHGHGRALLRTLAGLCVERGYTRLQWWVLDANEPAIAFYRSLGAKPMDAWTVFRVSGDALAELAD